MRRRRVICAEFDDMMAQAIACLASAAVAWWVGHIARTEALVTTATLTEALVTTATLTEEGDL
jgi:hypothetical protein